MAELQLNVGYRIGPKWMVGLYGTVAKYSLGSATPEGSDVWSGTVGVSDVWSGTVGVQGN